MMRLKNIILISFATTLLLSCAEKDVKKAIIYNNSEINTSLEDVVAGTEFGDVAGYIEKGVYIYKGVPYAEAERFMPPQKPKAWKGVKSTRAFGPTCPQSKRLGWYSDEQAFAFDWDDGFPDEDCLRLNIWTQGINDQGKRPVMVWLHGGGYSAGSGQELPSYDGAQLCKKGDVVIVTLNHRLNVLGFLDLSAFGEKYAKSGNVGLLDIVEALKWVQKNISNFGGDPENVTIFGQSGGGGKVSTLMATPSAKGLFKKAIVQSGSLLNTMESNYSRKIGYRIMEELNLKSSQVDKLSSLPYEQLLAAGNKAVAKVKEEARKDGFSAFIFGWAPTVDGNILPYQPNDIKGIKQSKDIPVIIGTTLHEFTSSTYRQELRNIDEKSAITELRKKFGDTTDEFLEAFKKAYPNYQPKDLFDVDQIFRPAAIKHAILKYNQHGAPVYNYLFAWESPVLDGALRSTHCMDLPFVFNNIKRCNKMTGGSEEAFELADKISSAWISFAKNGDPNTSGLETWEPFTPQNQATMVFNNQCEMKYNHDKELLEIVYSFPFPGF
jgi:para-nitrobenzyl esterase